MSSSKRLNKPDGSKLAKLGEKVVSTVGQVARVTTFGFDCVSTLGVAAAVELTEVLEALATVSKLFAPLREQAGRLNLTLSAMLEVAKYHSPSLACIPSLEHLDAPVQQLVDALDQAAAASGSGAARAVRALRAQRLVDSITQSAQMVTLVFLSVFAEMNAVIHAEAIIRDVGERDTTANRAIRRSMEQYLAMLGAQCASSRGSYHGKGSDVCLSLSTRLKQLKEKMNTLKAKTAKLAADESLRGLLQPTDDAADDADEDTNDDLGLVGPRAAAVSPDGDEVTPDDLRLGGGAGTAKRRPIRKRTRVALSPKRR